MPYAFFRVPAAPEPGAVDELNRFLRGHSVLAVQREWVSAGDGSFWAFCVQYADAGQGIVPRSGGTSASPKIDYKEILSEPEFKRYVMLRELRKALAEREGVPVFAVFTNEQLAGIAKSLPKSASDLKKIPGLGEARVAKHGTEVLAALAKDEAGEATL